MTCSNFTCSILSTTTSLLQMILYCIISVLLLILVYNHNNETVKFGVTLVRDSTSRLIIIIINIWLITFVICCVNCYSVGVTSTLQYLLLILASSTN